MIDKELIHHLTSLLSAKDEQNAALTRQIELLNKTLSDNQKETNRIVSQLSNEIKKLTKQLYGSKSEKLTNLKLKTQATTSSIVIASATTASVVKQQEVESKSLPVIEKPKQTKPPRRIYSGLEETTIMLEPLEDTTGARIVREEEVVRFSYVQARVVKIIYKRVIYGNGDKIFYAPFPSHLIERCLADNSLLAAIIANKYGYHIPIQRQLEIFKNIGIDWSKSTVNSWIARVIQILSPLFEELERQVTKSPYLNIDETTIPILIKGESSTKKGYIWGVISPKDKLVTFRYDQGSRSKKVLDDILEGYTGVIQSDGYAVYKDVGKGINRRKVRRIACLAHIRRKFIESITNDPRAKEGLDFITQLYTIEKVCYNPDLPPDKRMTEEQIKQYRLTYAVPLLKMFYRWLQLCSRDKSVLPKSAFGKTINYTLNEYPFLINYLRNGSYRVDNNAIERMNRAPVIGRKNYLFCGEHAGGDRTAKIYSLIESCKLNNIDPIAYLQDVLGRIMDHNHLKLYELLPNNWKQQDIL
ncbi:MAG: IS66 family transposase [Bacteroidales bacterium]